MDQQSRDVIPAVEMPRSEIIEPFKGAESQGLSQATEAAGVQRVETGSSLPSLPPTQPVAQGGVSVTNPQVSQPLVSGPAVTNVYAGSPAIADDADLIEKEWVEKAKEIVAQTKHDPHVQNKEMNKMKADYMKKRYNKDLKLGAE